jgi:hypothetical protein
LHTEPGWPLPFRIDPAEIGGRAEIVLVLLALLFGVCLVAAVILTAAGRYRRATLPVAGLAVVLGVAWVPLRPAVEPAYPTTYAAPAEPYAAPSVARGRPVYAENWHCATVPAAPATARPPPAWRFVPPT